MGRKVIQGSVIIVAMMFFLNFATFTEAVAGGVKAKPGEFPHAVQLSSIYTRDHFCGGSIIAPSVILTAAHCLIHELVTSSGELTEDEMPLEDILITAGDVWNREWSPFQEKEEHIRTVDRYVLHPEYDDLELYNDIALLFLETPLTFNDKVQSVRLPPPNLIFPSGTLAGWGITDGRNFTSPYLKKIELAPKDRETCNRDPLLVKKKDEVSAWELCAKFKKGSGLCEGDSGSSLVYKRSALVSDQQNKPEASSPPSIICGIATWVRSKRPCGESNSIGVFLDVSQYLPWIQNTMEDEGFGNLINPMPCSEPEGFYDCGEFGLYGERIKRRCILIGKKCDGVKNCENGRDENESICAAKNTSGILEEKVPFWLLLCVILASLILIVILIAVSYWYLKRSRSHDLGSSTV